MSSKTLPIPPLFRADTAAFEPEVSWCPGQRKSVGSHSVQRRKCSGLIGDRKVRPARAIYGEPKSNARWRANELISLAKLPSLRECAALPGGSRVAWAQAYLSRSRLL